MRKACGTTNVYLYMSHTPYATACATHFKLHHSAANSKPEAPPRQHQSGHALSTQRGSSVAMRWVGRQTKLLRRYAACQIRPRLTPFSCMPGLGAASPAAAMRERHCDANAYPVGARDGEAKLRSNHTENEK
jgi:hypothetical protein